jgi:hypothetical protein
LLPNDVASKVDSISVSDIRSIAKSVLASKPTLVVTGDIYDTPTLEELSAQLK